MNKGEEGRGEGRERRGGGNKEGMKVQQLRD